MSTQRRKHLFAAIPVMASAMLLTALTTPATAQSEACVSLQVGSGYVATMSVPFAGGTIGPSPQFTAGHTQCLPLAGIGDGVRFSVEVRALSGETATCTPANLVRSVTLFTAITFNATGTTQNVLCYAHVAGPGALGAAGPPASCSCRCQCTNGEVTFFSTSNATTCHFGCLDHCTNSVVSSSCAPH